MIKPTLNALRNARPAPTAEAHCDGPCGVYDPASIRIAAEAAVSMTKKMLALTPPDASDSDGDGPRCPVDPGARDVPRRTSSGASGREG